MNVDEFKVFAKATVDYICDYFENIRKFKVLPAVSPGYLSHCVDKRPPHTGDNWRHILEDVDNVIMPGLTHWHSPNFHAYYPTANSYPGIVAELILSGLGTISIDWASNPASMELEVKMMDWLAKLLDLPKHFLNSDEGPGGGVIQNAASESTLVALLAAKSKKLKDLSLRLESEKGNLEGKLVAYTSEQSNSSVEKAGLLASVPMRLLPTDEQCSLRGEALREAIKRDKERGFIPCCVVATLGTTGTCAFDNLEELGNVCQEENMWLHVDAAYAGTAFSCPEYRHQMKGIEYVDSFNFNPHKWMLVNSDCSAMWFKNTASVEEAFKISKDLYIPADYKPEIQHWQIPNVRRFRALKIWFVLRIYGVKGIQKHVRQQVLLAKYFEKLVSSDSRFEVCTSSLAVVCFRLKGEDKLTKELLDKLSERRNIFVMPYYYHNKLVIRFVVCSRLTEMKDVIYAWNEIVSQADVSSQENGKNVDYIHIIHRKSDNFDFPLIQKSVV